MKRTILLFLSFVATFFIVNSSANDVVIHSNTGNGHDQISVDPPYVTYDDDLNELYVYFGSTGTIDLEYLDPTGMPCTLVNGESHTRLHLSGLMLEKWRS